VKYLINHYGKERFISVYSYKGYNLLDEIEKVFKTKLEQFEKDFLDSLNQ
jgi:hypothetical protein